MAVEVEVRVEGPVGIVTVCRPPHNYFDLKLISEIASAFAEIDENSDIRAVVLASQGNSFCAGAQFADTSDFSSAGFESAVKSLYDAGACLLRTKKPIIAAVQGAAVGGGLGLALIADFRVASLSSRFTCNFVKIGIHPGFGLTVTLPRLVGKQKAAELFLTGKRIGGEEALAIGLIDRLVPENELLSSAIALAREIAVNAPLAVMSVRETLRQGLFESVSKQMERERIEQVWLRATADAEEGIRAVAERRDGVFLAR